MDEYDELGRNAFPANYGSAEGLRSHTKTSRRPQILRPVCERYAMLLADESSRS
jgi:hypothetical protein